MWNDHYIRTEAINCVTISFINTTACIPIYVQYDDPQSGNILYPRPILNPLIQHLQLLLRSNHPHDSFTSTIILLHLLLPRQHNPQPIIPTLTLALTSPTSPSRKPQPLPILPLTLHLHQTTILNLFHNRPLPSTTPPLRRRLLLTLPRIFSHTNAIAPRIRHMQHVM